MKLFVALVVLCCALSAHGACQFAYPQFTGGVLDENGDYIPGSVLAWVDVAKNYLEYADAAGIEWLETWIGASESYDDSLKGPQVIPSIATRSINLANRCFCNLGTSFQDSAINQWYNDLCDQFGYLLENGTDAQVNQFMVEAYPQFNDFIC